MDIDLFKKAIDQLPKLKKVKIQGMGEPLLNKNLPEFIKYAQDQNIKTQTITNGTVLNPEIAHQLLEAKLSDLTFSIDGATKNTYESLRVNAKYDTVTKNIQHICDIKKKLGFKTEISIVCLVSNREVLSEVPQLVELASQLGVDKVSIKKRLKIWEQENNGSSYSFTTSYLDSFPDFMEILDQSDQIAKKNHIKLKIEQDSDYSASNPCLWPFKSLYVSTEGKIVPCCVLAMPETWCMGDLNEDTLETIWNNKPYRELRRKIALNQVPETCINCYRPA
jgi:pyrroloquinoline quinone biosynthesis protein E